MLDTKFLEQRPEVKVTAIVTQKQYSTLCDPKIYSHTKIRDSYAKKYRRYVQDMIIVDLGPEVKFKVTQNWYTSVCDPNMHPYTKFGILTSKYVGDMLRAGYALADGWILRGTDNVITICLPMGA